VKYRCGRFRPSTKVKIEQGRTLNFENGTSLMYLG